jgi:hypothetical protein
LVHDDDALYWPATNWWVVFFLSLWHTLMHLGCRYYFGEKWRKRLSTRILNVSENMWNVIYFMILCTWIMNDVHQKCWWLW